MTPAADLTALLRDQTGLDLTADSVERAVRERTLRLGLRARAAYAPAPGSEEFAALVDLLVVPESWMLRDPPVFDVALAFVRRRLAARPQAQVRILSLPCAAGEEAYSMALTLAGAGIAPAACRIDAVDLSAAAIRRARAGRYTNNAFRGAGLAARARWFTADGDDWLVVPALRDYVSFSQGNLFALDDAIAHTRYDLVFCRNLLIYVDDAGRAHAARVLMDLLADGGLLLAGCAEAPALCTLGFAADSLATPFALGRRRTPARAPQRPRPARALRPIRQAPPPRPPMPLPPPVQAAPAAPAIPPDLLAQARGAADAGRLDEARDLCRSVLASAPACAEAYYLLGLVDDCAGQSGAAEASLRRCLYLDPRHYEALCALALLRERDGDAALAASLRARAARVYAQRNVSA